MLYMFLGSALLGALSTTFLLWRKSVVEKKLVASQDAEKEALDRASRALTELADRSKAFDTQLALQTDQITVIRGQRDAALTQLAKSNTPGSIAELIRLQNLPKPTGNP